jgi:hypothetical protein
MSPLKSEETRTRFFNTRSSRTSLVHNQALRLGLLISTGFSSPPDAYNESKLSCAAVTACDSAAPESWSSTSCTALAALKRQA